MKAFEPVPGSLTSSSGAGVTRLQRAGASFRLRIVGVVDKGGGDVAYPQQGQMVADLCVVGGYTQYPIRPARVSRAGADGDDPTEAVCIPPAYLTAFQMLTATANCLRAKPTPRHRASGTVGTALLDLARHFGLNAIGTCSAANMAVVEGFGAAAIDYRDGDFVDFVETHRPGPWTHCRGRRRVRCHRRRAL